MATVYSLTTMRTTLHLPFSKSLSSLHCSLSLSLPVQDHAIFSHIQLATLLAVVMLWKLNVSRRPQRQLKLGGNCWHTLFHCQRNLQTWTTRWQAVKSNNWWITAKDCRASTSKGVNSVSNTCVSCQRTSWNYSYNYTYPAARAGRCMEKATGRAGVSEAWETNYVT